MKEQIKVNVLMNTILSGLENIDSYELVEPILTDYINKSTVIYILNKPLNDTQVFNLNHTRGFKVYPDNITIRVCLDEVVDNDYAEITLNEITKKYRLDEIITVIKKHTRINNINDYRIYGIMDYMMKTNNIPDLLKNKVSEYFNNDLAMIGKYMRDLTFIADPIPTKLYKFVEKLAGFKPNTFDIDDLERLGDDHLLNIYGDKYIKLNETILSSGLLQLGIFDQYCHLHDIDIDTGEIYVNDGYGNVLIMVLENGLLTSPAKLIENMTSESGLKKVDELMIRIRRIVSSLIDINNGILHDDINKLVNIVFNGHDVNNSNMAVIRGIFRKWLTNSDDISKNTIDAALDHYRYVLRGLFISDSIEPYADILSDISCELFI